MASHPQPQPRSDASVREFGRDFLAFSIQHGIHCVPIDDVTFLLAMLTLRCDCVPTNPHSESSGLYCPESFQEHGTAGLPMRCQAVEGLALGKHLLWPRLTFRKEELNRQADFYDIISRLLERRLFLPLDLTPEFVLDCGSGSGIEWAEEVMEKSELGPGSSSSEDDDFACQVVAVDIFHTEGSSPGVVKKRWNLNGAFRYDQEELARDKYDLVNSRFLADSINANRWGSYIQDLHDRLRAGGWLQMLEAQFHIQSHSGRSLEYLSRWWSIYSQALEGQNKDPRVGTELSRYMGNAGLVNIAMEPKQLPVGEWHQDPRLREIGRDMKPIAVQTLRSLGIWHCRQAGMQEADFEDLIAGCEREISDTSLRLYIPLFAVWGQKAELGQKRVDNEGAAYVPDPSRRLPPPVDWI